MLFPLLHMEHHFYLDEMVLIHLPNLIFHITNVLFHCLFVLLKHSFYLNPSIETPTTKVASPNPYGLTGGILE